MIYTSSVCIEHPTIQTILLNVCTDCVRRPEFDRRCPATEDLVHTMTWKAVRWEHQSFSLKCQPAVCNL